MLTIFKGDDTGGTFGRPLHFTINTGADVDLAGCRAEFEFDGIVKAFSKRKSSIMPSAPTMSEVVMLTVLFDLLKDMTEARKDDESDEDIANDLRGEEQERDPDDE